MPTQPATAPVSLSPKPKAKEKEKPTDSRPKIEPEPATKARLLTFAEAWDEAKELGAALDKEEPALTARALKLLTNDERDVVERFDMPHYALFGGGGATDAAGRISKAGLGAWLAKKNRPQAFLSDDFKTVLTVLWDERAGARGVLAAANVWWGIELFTRRDVIRVVGLTPFDAKRDPRVRDAILLLGGEEWLAR